MPDESIRPEKTYIRLSSLDEQIDKTNFGKSKREIKQPSANGANKFKLNVAIAWMI